MIKGINAYKSIKIKLKILKREFVYFITNSFVVLLLLLLAIFVIIKHSNIEVFPLFSEFNILIRPDTETNSYETLSFFKDLSMAYIASFIFYIFVEYIPKRVSVNANYYSLQKDFIDLRNSIIDFIIFNDFVFEKDSKEHDANSSNNKSVNKEYIIKENQNLEGIGDSIKKIRQDKYYHNLTLKVISIVKNIKIKNLNLDRSVMKILNQIESNIIFLIYSKDSAPLNRLKNTIILNYDKAIYEIKQFPNAINAYIEEDKIYNPQICLGNNNEYIERLKFFVFRMDSSIMTVNNKYIEKSLNTIYEIYKNSKIESEKISLANEQLLEYIKVFDFDSKMIDKFMDKVYHLSKLIVTSANDMKEIHYLNMLQIKKRMNIEFNKQEVDNITAIIQKKDKYLSFGCYVLLDNLKEAALLFEQLDDNEKSIMINTPIYKLFENLDKKLNLIEVNIRF